MIFGVCYSTVLLQLEWNTASSTCFWFLPLFSAAGRPLLNELFSARNFAHLLITALAIHPCAREFTRKSIPTRTLPTHLIQAQGRDGGKAAGQTAPPVSKPSEDFDDDGDLDLSASLWFQTLDKILSAKGAVSRGEQPAGAGGGRSVGGGGRRRRGGELPQTAAVMGGVLDALLQRTLSSMAGEMKY